MKDINPNNIRENNFSQSPVGSGPFKLSFIQNIDTTSTKKIIYMDRNDQYYNGKANLSRFQLYIYNTKDEIVQALSINEVNAASDLSLDDTKKVDLKRYVVQSEPIQSGVYAILNTKSTFLNDVNLRSALRLATDTSSIRKKLSDTNLSLDLPFTNNQLFGEVPKAPSYNQDEAKKLLDDNGWKLNDQKLREKDGQILKITIVTMKDSELEIVLETISKQWRDIGISVETKVVDPNDVTQNVVQQILQPRNFDVLLYQLDIGADPDVYAYWHSSQASSQGLNYANYSNTIS